MLPSVICWGTWATSYNPTAWTCSHRTNYQSYAIPMAVQGYPPTPFGELPRSMGKRILSITRR
ncbi:Uncharacterised protein [Citrobacter koseri]|nr:Uncharacterised protein [Citrobacter koseri]